MDPKDRRVRLLAPPDFSRRVDVPAWLVAGRLAEGWRMDPAADTRDELQRSLPGSHVGSSALVVASGPSAGMADFLSVLRLITERRPVVYAVNDAWRVLGGRSVPADYLVVLDEHFWGLNTADIHAYLRRNPKCLPVVPWELQETRPYYQIPIALNETPDTSPEYRPGHFFHGLSSGIAAVQMAMQAGCNPIYLLGHDCGVAAGKTHGFGVRSSGELSGAYPQGLEMLAGYDTLRRHAESLGVRVLNLAPAGVGRMDFFPRVSFVEALANGKVPRR